MAPLDPLAAFARALAPYLRAELAPTPELVDLARIGVAKRAVFRAARDGDIEGAVKIERRWYAPRAGVEKWIAEHAPTANGAQPLPVRGDEDPELAAMRARLGLRLVGGKRR